MYTVFYIETKSNYYLFIENFKTYTFKPLRLSILTNFKLIILLIVRNYIAISSTYKDFMFI